MNWLTTFAGWDDRFIDTYSKIGMFVFFSLVAWIPVAIIIKMVRSMDNSELTNNQKGLGNNRKFENVILSILLLANITMFILGLLGVS
jgi:hypothetical protein